MSKKKITKSQLQLLGVTTLWVASKYEEIYPPELNDFLLVSENKFTRAEIIKMEKDLLATMNFMITVPSSFRFL